jgi:lycopene beta-cyclase
MRIAEKYPQIIIAGGGLSGLSLALEFEKHPAFADVSLCIIDRVIKKDNDRTWCFWAKHNEVLPPVLHRTWDKALFYGTNYEAAYELSPYRYCMVRSADFYRYAREILDKNPNVQFIQDDIQEIDETNGIVYGKAGEYAGDLIFNSAFTARDLLPKQAELQPKPQFSTQNTAKPLDPGHTWLLQHFKGWIIETESDFFDPAQITLMDYRVEQLGDTRFVYVLPLSARSALVEYTVFSPELSPTGLYDQELSAYIERYLQIPRYRIVEQEFGVIPMSDFPFPWEQSGKVIPIGTAAGFVKPSSGYAFLRTQRKLRRFVEDWAQNGQPNPQLMRSARVFRATDAILLRVLRDRAYPGKDFFTDLFSKVPSEMVFRFLDEDATAPEVLRVMRAAPMGVFLKKTLALLGRL